ncbi:MAG: permease [Thermoplasmatota archaeon]
MADRATRLHTAIAKALRGFAMTLPVLLGVVLLLGLFKTHVTPDMIAAVFTGACWHDVPLGAAIGSISAGNPITSYVIGGELLDSNVSLFAVTAFIVAWVTVGIVQLPAEIGTLGRRFALLRTILSFLLALLVSAITVAIVGMIP